MKLKVISNYVATLLTFVCMASVATDALAHDGCNDPDCHHDAAPRPTGPVVSADDGGESQIEPAFYHGTYYVIDNDAYNVTAKANPEPNEWRNACFTHWAWGHEQRTVTDEEGNETTSDEWYDESLPGMGGWLSNDGQYSGRNALIYTGYAITIDGKDYPVYKGELRGRLRVSADPTANKEYDDSEYLPLTGFLLTYETGGKREQLNDLPFAAGNAYLFFGDNRGLYKANYDPATDPDTHLVGEEELAEHGGKEYTVYFNGKGFTDEDTRDYSYNPEGADYYWPNPTCETTKIHVWGPGGDLTPWAYGRPATGFKKIRDDYGQELDAYFYTGKGWLTGCSEFKFTYFGGDPQGIIFRQHSVEPATLKTPYGSEKHGCEACGEEVYLSSKFDSETLQYLTYYPDVHRNMRVDYQVFKDGALYQYVAGGNSMTPILHPIFTSYKPYEGSDEYNPEETDLEEHTIWFLDIDNWFKIAEGDTPDCAEYNVMEYIPEYGYWDQKLDEDWKPVKQKADIGYTGLHAEMTNARYWLATSYYGEYTDPESGETIYCDNVTPDKLKSKCHYYNNGYLVLATEFSDADHPWGTPATDLMVDYDEMHNNPNPYLRYAKFHDKWYPLIKLNFKLSSMVDKIVVNRYGTPRSTDWLPVVDGGVYYYGGVDIKTPILNYDNLEIIEAHSLAEIPKSDVGQERTIYVNFGANKMMQPSEWQHPYLFPYWRDWTSNPSGKDRSFGSIVRRESIDGEGKPEYAHMIVAPIPPHVKFGTPEYENSELKKYEMTPVPGRPGMYSYTIDDVSKYNDLICYYYRYGPVARLRDCTYQEFYDYVTAHGGPAYNASESYNGSYSFPNSDEQTIGVEASKEWHSPISGYFKFKIQTNEAGEFLDENNEPTLVECTQNEYKNNYGTNHQDDEWVYIQINHLNNNGKQCCELAPTTKNQAKNYYYKAKIDHSIDYVQDYYDGAETGQFKYYMGNSEVGNYLKHSMANIYYPETSITPYSEGWRYGLLVIKDSYFDYKVVDYIEENDEPYYYGVTYDEGGNAVVSSGVSGEWGHNAFPASRSKWHDPAAWDKYVYDIGIDCLHQSYMTPEEMLALPEIPTGDADETVGRNIKQIYLAGNEVVTGKPEWDLRNMVKIESEQNVFFHDFSNVIPGKPAEFKITTVDVAKYADRAEQEYFDGFYNYQRGWATFNLGLIGPHKLSTDPGYQQWYDAHVEPGDPTRKVKVFVDETYDYDAYTQYSWKVEVFDETDETEGHGMKPGNYYFVIDFLPTERTVTLLDFDPHPHPEFENISIRTLDLDDTQTVTLHNNGKNFAFIPGSEHSGPAHHNKVNVISADIKFNDTPMEKINYEGYNVAYTIYINGELAAYQTQFENFDMDGNLIPEENMPEWIEEDKPFMKRPKKLSIDFLDLSDDASIAVRGRYIYKNGLKFSSKLRSEDISGLLANLNAPQVPTISDNTAGKGVRAIIVGDRKDQKATMAAAATITYTPNASYGTKYDEDGNPIQVQLHSFPGYKVKSLVMGGDSINIDELSHPLIHFGHPIMTNSPVAWTKYLGHDLTGESTIEMDEPHYWHPEHPESEDINNWAGYVMKGCSMPIVVENIGGIVGWDEIPDYSKESEMVVSAVTSYPFLVRDYGKYIVKLPDDFYNVDIPEVNVDKETPAESNRRVIMRAEGDSESETLDQSGRDDIDANGVPSNLKFYKISLSQRGADLTVDLPSVLIATGLKDLMAEPDGIAADAEYYNLQGIRVDGSKLTKGIYIEKRGKETRKVLL